MRKRQSRAHSSPESKGSLNFPGASPFTAWFFSFMHRFMLERADAFSPRSPTATAPCSGPPGSPRPTGPGPAPRPGTSHLRKPLGGQKPCASALAWEPGHPPPPTPSSSRQGARVTPLRPVPLTGQTRRSGQGGARPAPLSRPPSSALGTSSGAPGWRPRQSRTTYLKTAGTASWRGIALGGGARHWDQGLPQPSRTVVWGIPGPRTPGAGRGSRGSVPRGLQAPSGWPGQPPWRAP